MASVPAEALLALAGVDPEAMRIPPKECRLPEDRYAVGTLDMHLGSHLPGEQLVGDLPAEVRWRGPGEGSPEGRVLCGASGGLLIGGDPERVRPRGAFCAERPEAC